MMTDDAPVVRKIELEATGSLLPSSKLLPLFVDRYRDIETGQEKLTNPSVPILHTVWQKANKSLPDPDGDNYLDKLRALVNDLLDIDTVSEQQDEESKEVDHAKRSSVVFALAMTLNRLTGGALDDIDNKQAAQIIDAAIRLGCRLQQFDILLTGTDRELTSRSESLVKATKTLKERKARAHAIIAEAADIIEVESQEYLHATRDQQNELISEQAIRIAVERGESTKGLGKYSVRDARAAGVCR